VSATYSANEQAPGVTGGGGNEVFVFESIAAGDAEILFWYMRPWDSDPEEIKTYTATVDENLHMTLVEKEDE